jgi:hypothetical protein
MGCNVLGKLRGFGIIERSEDYERGVAEEPNATTEETADRITNFFSIYIFIHLPLSQRFSSLSGILFDVSEYKKNVHSATDWPHVRFYGL